MTTYDHSGPNPSGRRTIASFAAYPDADRTVDYLADWGFPVGRVVICRRDMRLVELVTGPSGFLKVTVRDGVCCALTGGVVGCAVGLFTSIPALVMSSWFAWCGLVLSMMQPGGYDLVVDETVAEPASALLRHRAMGSPL